MRGKVEICGINTAKLPTLKNDEMMDLLSRSQKGDTQARDKLIYGNLRLVLSVIQRFTGRGSACADDLFQVGCIGLMKAIDHFDVTQGVRFSTYGVPRVVVWGKSRKVADMTNSKAFQTIITYLDSIPNLSPDLCKAKCVLQELRNGIPWKVWDDVAIRSAIESFIKEHGRPPRIKEMDKYPYLPSHPTVERQYGMTAGKWMNINYPLGESQNWRWKYENYTEESFRNIFIEQYNSIRPTSAVDYNKRRDHRSPTWQYIAKVLCFNTWTELRDSCKNELSHPSRKGEIDFIISSTILEIDNT